MTGVLKELFHVTKFEYVQKRFVSSFSEYFPSSEGKITLSGNGTWKEVLFTPGTAFIGEQRIIDDPANFYYRIRFTGSLPAKEAGFPQFVRELTDEPVYCRLQISTGQVFLLGAVRVEYSLDGEGHDVEVRFNKNLRRGLLEDIFNTPEPDGSGE